MKKTGIFFSLPEVIHGQKTDRPLAGSRGGEKQTGKFDKNNVIPDEIQTHVIYYDGMPFPKPTCSTSQVKTAGEKLAKGRGKITTNEAYLILNNWRSSHGYPVNTFQSTLRSRLGEIDKKAIVAQRLKRTPSIVKKLQRFQQMKLSTMQDIGGLRAILTGIKQVHDLRDRYVEYRHSAFRHELINEMDYISDPKDSGYRGIHLIYKYQNNKVPEYNGMRIELQIRTYLQHIWATAVETFGMLFGKALKSSEGPDEWLKFFSLTAASFAHIEKTSAIPGYEDLSSRDTYRATIENAEALHVKDKLSMYNIALQHLAVHGTRAYYLLVLDIKAPSISTWSFSRDQLIEANDEYTEKEQECADDPNKQVVLVSAGSWQNVRKAYPAFFLDTHEFLSKIDNLKRRV